MGKRKLTAAVFVGLTGRVDPKEGRQRIAERDAREAADTRTRAQIRLGDTPPGRSALAQTTQPTPQRSPASHPRIDLWTVCRFENICRRDEARAISARAAARGSRSHPEAGAASQHKLHSHLRASPAAFDAT